MEVKSPPPGKEGIVGYRCGYRCGYRVRWGSKVEVKSPPPRQGRHSRVQVWVQVWVQGKVGV